MMNVSIELIATIALWVAALGFLRSIHRDVINLRKDVGKDIADLRERMARVESLPGNLVERPPKPQT